MAVLCQKIIEAEYALGIRIYDKDDKKVIKGETFSVYGVTAENNVEPITQEPVEADGVTGIIPIPQIKLRKYKKLKLVNEAPKNATTPANGYKYH